MADTAPVPAAAEATAVPYHMKEAVNTAKYHPPAYTPRKTMFSSSHPGDLKPSMFKTEKWRERGVERWPPSAVDELGKRPTQFSKSQEVVPLQRMADEEGQPNIHSELWTRALRMPGLHIQEHVGPQNQNAFTSAVKCMFNEHGVGWTGKTNRGKKKLPNNPAAWVECPVAVGKYSTEHMGGSRYGFDLTPRPCVPASMAHASKTM
jgi:hypothetical protein